METCVIFCAAEFDSVIEPVGADCCVIAADGGLRHVQALELEPNIILGDFDSLGHVPEGANVFPVEKDDTDAMLAVRRGLAMGYKRFLIYGGMDGPRVDHTMANFQTLQFLADHGARGYLIGINSIASVVKNGELRFPEGLSGDFSVFCLGPDARGVHLEGFYYPLQDGVLTSGFPLGVSNHFTGAAACAAVAEGSLLAIWNRSAGLPEETELC